MDIKKEIKKLDWKISKEVLQNEAITYLYDELSNEIDENSTNILKFVGDNLEYSESVIKVLRYNISDDVILEPFLTKDEVSIIMYRDMVESFSLQTFKHSSELNNLINQVEIDRSIFISNIRVKSIVYLYIGLDRDKYLRIMLKSLISLRGEYLITRKIIQKSTKRRSITLALVGVIRPPFDIKSYIRYSRRPYNLIVIDKVMLNLSLSYSSICPASTSSPTNKVLKVNKSAIIKANRIGYSLNYQMLRPIRNTIEAGFTDLLKGCNVSINIGVLSEEGYLESIISRLIDDIVTTKELKLDADWGALVGSKDDRQSLFDDVNWLKELEVYFSSVRHEIFNFLVLKCVLGFKSTIYFPNMVDFRGRIYPLSCVSPTFSKSLRSAYVIDSVNINIPSIENSGYYKSLSKFFCLINSGSKIRDYFLILLYIEIGFLFAKSILTRGRYSLPLEDIIKLGISKSKLGGDSLPSEDFLYFTKIVCEINSIGESKGLCVSDITIHKDATASGYQNFGLILGYKKSLKFFNLEGDSWCDTYWFIIDQVLLKMFGSGLLTDEDFSRISLFVNRKTLKKPIMTAAYNVSEYSSWLYFKGSVLEEFGDLNSGILKVLRDFHLKFYKILNEELFVELFAKKEIIHKDYIFSFDGRSFDARYYKVIGSHQERIYFKKKSDKYQHNEYLSSKKPDLSKNSRDIIISVPSSLSEGYEGCYKVIKVVKTERALKANVMHFLDSNLVYYILRRPYSAYTVHDMFVVNIKNTHLLMDDINKYYSDFIPNKKYSPVIVS